MSDSHAELDAAFPHYNPPPEFMETLPDLRRALRVAGFDLSHRFTGDGSPCTVVAQRGEEIFADEGA